MLVKTYAGEVANTPMRVNLIDPGIVRTSMRAVAMPGEDPMTLACAGVDYGCVCDAAASGCKAHGEVVRG